MGERISLMGIDPTTHLNQRGRTGVDVRYKKTIAVGPEDADAICAYSEAKYGITPPEKQLQGDALISGLPKDIDLIIEAIDYVREGKKPAGRKAS